MPSAEVGFRCRGTRLSCESYSSSMRLVLRPVAGGSDFRKSMRGLPRVSTTHGIFPRCFYKLRLCCRFFLFSSLQRFQRLTDNPVQLLCGRTELSRISHRIPAASADSATVRARIGKTPDCSMSIRLLRRFINLRPRSSALHALATKFREICGL